MYKDNGGIKMKKLLTSVLAASVLGTSVLFGGLTANANEFEDNVDNEANQDEAQYQRRGIWTEGSIKFEPDNSPVIVVPPGDDDLDIDIPPSGEGENFGPLTIAYAPTLNFGTQTVSVGTKKYYMIAEWQTSRANGEEKVPYVSFVQVQDSRGTNDGWSLHLTAEPFKSDDANHPDLAGAKINFFNSHVVHNGDEYYPTGENPISPELSQGPNFSLNTNGQPEKIMEAASGKGAGISSLVWGDQTRLDEDHKDKNISEVLNHAIQLEIPGTSLQYEAEYNATLHWQLVAGHDNTLPESP